MSTVFASWVFAGSFGRSRSLKKAAPELLAHVLALRSEAQQAFSTAIRDFGRRPDEALSFAAHLEDSGAGLRALTLDLGGADGDPTGRAILAEADFLAQLGGLLREDPFSLTEARADAVSRSSDAAKTLLAQAMRDADVQVLSGDPLAWKVEKQLGELVRASQDLREAASATDLIVEATTQDSVTVRWRASDDISWAGIWLTVDLGDPVFVTGSEYRITGLDPLQTIEVSGRVALGAGGRYRGPSTRLLEATTDHPPYSMAWLGNWSLDAYFEVTSESYNGIYVGDGDGGALTLESSCAQGPCPANLTLTGFDIAFDSSSYGEASVEDGQYELTVSGMNLGYQGSCDLRGTRTIRFRVTGAEMIDGIWTATELTGSINHLAVNCQGRAYLDTSLWVSYYQGD